MNLSTTDNNALAYIRQEMELSQQFGHLTSWYGDEGGVFEPQNIKDKVWGYIEKGECGNKTERLNQSVVFMEDMNQKLFRGEATIEDMLETDISTYKVRA